MSSIYQQLTETDVKLEKDLRTIGSAHPASARIAKTPNLTGIKAALWGAYFLTLLTLLGGVYIYYTTVMESQERLSLQANHVALSKRTVALEAALEDQKKKVQGYGDQLDQSISKQDQARLEIKREIDNRRLEIADLQQKLQSLSVPASMEGGAASEVPSATYSAPRIEYLEPMGPSMEETVQAPVEETAAAPAAESPAVAQPSALEPQAQKILTVNRQFKFVVINLGQSDNVQLGNKLKVLRSGQEIGRVQIEKLYDSFSAATILQEDSKLQIEVGDAIVPVA